MVLSSSWCKNGTQWKHFWSGCRKGSLHVLYLFQVVPCPWAALWCQDVRRWGGYVGSGLYTCRVASQGKIIAHVSVFWSGYLLSFSQYLVSAHCSPYLLSYTTMVWDFWLYIVSILPSVAIFGRRLRPRSTDKNIWSFGNTNRRDMASKCLFIVVC